MRPIPFYAVPVTLFVALALPASGSHCESWSTTQPTFRCLVPSDVAGTYYAVEDCCGLTAPIDCMWSFWVYEESNGIAGLQRGDDVVDDTCHGQIRPDTIVF